MFVVTGLHTKRRPHIGTDKPTGTIRKQYIGKLGLLPPVTRPHQRLRPVKLSASVSSLSPASPRVSEPRMVRNDSEKSALNRNEQGRPPPIKVPLAPARVRRFIPKPLILVERMKARQLLLGASPPVASEYCAVPGSLNCPRTAVTTPLSTHMTPTTRRIRTCSTLSSDSHHSSSVSFRVSLRNDVVFGSGFGMMPRSVRPLSVVALRDSSSSTDTFVTDSPCCIKRASFKVPLLVTETDAANHHLDVGSDPRKKCVPYTGVPVLVNSVAADVVHRTCHTDTFKPAVTSTPFASSQANTNGIPSPTAFITSTVYPICPPEQTPGLSDESEIVSPTSRAMYSFNAPKSAYIVKLPNSGSTISLSNGTSLASLDFGQLSSRAAPASPTLVLDGVFALPQLSPSSLLSPHRTLNGFHRPRKPASRRPLADISNVPAIASPSQPVPLSTSQTSSCGESGPESPRTKLAHVLTTHARSQTMDQTRKHTRVPPLVRGVWVSNDPRTQCEIEGLRMRRVVGLGRGHGLGGNVGGDGGGRGTIGRMSLAGVGMVAKLRTRWETGDGTLR
ncbi:hypothetical protein HD554DRAFT_2251303 [Boletus coccyginus]|nr:hypothetical protein HD554DRAFT_2251303 [Boletus coccyginus]